MRWLPAGALALLTSPAAAQLPVYVPAEPEPVASAPAEQPAMAPDGAAPAATAPPAAAAVTDLPPAPAAPPGAAGAPVSPGPASARAAMLTERPAELEDDEPDASYGQELGPRRTWYGWQTLTADGASLALILLAGSLAGSSRGDDDGASNVALLGALSYTITPGVIHFVHRNPGRGFASFGVRLGLPIAGAMVGAAAASGCNEYLCEGQGAAIGGLLGIGGAIAIDAAVFAYDDRKPRDAARSSWAPLLLLSKNRALLGVGGAL